MPDIFTPPNHESIAQAHALLRSVKSGALATLEHETGHPTVTRVSCAPDVQGGVQILVSQIARHTQSLMSNPNCALLCSPMEKGDDLASPRLTLTCIAKPILRDHVEFADFARRHLAHNPKTKLYLALPDFVFFSLNIVHASYFAGFGKSYQIDAQAWQSGAPK